MKQYDDATLHKVQMIELSILKDFIDLCERHDLIYFGVAGTGIGAVRHKGFIPWDDDIDVAMPREDYEKFVAIARQEYEGTYKVLNADTRKNYPLMTAQWAKVGTTFVTEPFKRVDCDFGIYLDIFPLDYVSDDDEKYHKQAKTAWFWSKLMILRNLPFPTVAFSGVKKYIAYAVFGSAHLFLKICCVSKHWLYRNSLSASKRYGKEKSKRMSFMCETSPFNNEFTCDDVFPLQKLEFEGLQMNFPKNLDKILRGYYGDYMQLPPSDKRINHYPFKLDFGDE